MNPNPCPVCSAPLPNGDVAPDATPANPSPAQAHLIRCAGAALAGAHEAMALAEVLIHPPSGSAYAVHRGELWTAPLLAVSNVPDVMAWGPVETMTEAPPGTAEAIGATLGEKAEALARGWGA
jgi:hypothetical protein